MRVLMRKAFVAALLTVLIAGTTATGAAAHGRKAGVLPPGAHPFGRSMAAWQGKWWNWFVGIPAATNPAFVDNCGANQKGSVWYLSQTFFGTSIVQHCEIPYGTFLLASGGGAISDTDILPGATDAELLADARTITDTIADVHITVDGVDVENVDRYHVPSRGFTVRYPHDNIFGATAGKFRAVSDGWFAMITPLRPGNHEVIVRGTSGGDTAQVTFEIVVLKPHEAHPGSD